MELYPVKMGGVHDLVTLACINWNEQANKSLRQSEDFPSVWLNVSYTIDHKYGNRNQLWQDIYGAICLSGLEGKNLIQSVLVKVVRKVTISGAVLTHEVLMYNPSSVISLANPKSPTFATMFGPIKTFLAARSR